MFWSRNTYFHKSSTELKTRWEHIAQYLGYRNLDIEYYKNAYDYFVVNSKDFDGATIVKDLTDMYGLDLSAMRHDYEYLIELKKFRWWKWLKYKIRVDFEYGKNMENLGKGVFVPYFRTFVLWISTPIYAVIIVTKKIF